VELSWIIVSRINPVPSHGEHAQSWCDIESKIHDPWRIWRDFSDPSEVGLILAAQKRDDAGNFEIKDGGSPLKCVLTSSVGKE
jgi:hypothetical protein